MQRVLFVICLASSLSLSSWPSGAVALSSDSRSGAFKPPMLHVISVQAGMSRPSFSISTARRSSATLGTAATPKTTFRLPRPPPIIKIESSSRSLDFVADKLESPDCHVALLNVRYHFFSSRSQGP